MFSHGPTYDKMINMYREEDPDIKILNSHSRVDTDRIKIYGYQVCQVNASQEPNDGGAIAVHNNINHKIIDDLEEIFISLHHINRYN